jgi:hypothetical protein
MGNYGSYGTYNGYVNPFVMVDYTVNDQFNEYNRFACDINDDSSKTAILGTANQRVKDYNLASLFKNMVINYNGSKEGVYLNNTITDSNHIRSDGRLPGGAYRDDQGALLEVYKRMACCKGALAPDAIGSETGKKSVSIPIATVVMPGKDFLKPIYSDVVTNPKASVNRSQQFTRFEKTVTGVNPNTQPFFYDTDFRAKINLLNDDQLDSIISSCAHGSMCIKSNIVGLQIKGNTETICGTYTPDGQIFAKNQEANPNAKCHSIMKHICAKQLYDQGCIGMKLDAKGVKYPGWFDGPMCRSYNALTDLTGTKGFFAGTPDCTCINAMTGYTLNNKPSFNTLGENPYNLDSRIDSDYYNSGGETPYALNVWNHPYVSTMDRNNGNGDPIQDDPNCNDSITKHFGAYLLPKYYVAITATQCKNQIILNGNTTNDITMMGINQTNNCGVNALSTARANLERSQQGIGQASIRAFENRAASQEAAQQKLRDQQIASQQAYQQRTGTPVTETPPATGTTQTPATGTTQTPATGTTQTPATGTTQTPATGTSTPPAAGTTPPATGTSTPPGTTPPATGTSTPPGTSRPPVTPRTPVSRPPSTPASTPVVTPTGSMPPPQSNMMLYIGGAVILILIIIIIVIVFMMSGKKK